MITVENSEKISGNVKRIVYRNDSNMYTVAEVAVGKEKITVVGIMPFLSEGDVADFYGKFTLHQSYGQQFSVTAFERKTPENTAQILKYLSAGAIKGIGPATALKIVERFGEESLNIIESSPELLTEIKGITPAKALSVSEEYKKQTGIKDIMLMLSKYKVSLDRCLNIHKKFGMASVATIKANPYALCIEGIDLPFELAETIAQDLNFDMQSELRITAGLEYILRKNLANGHTCLPRDKFISVAVKLLEARESTVEICCDKLIDCFKITSKTVGKTEFLAIAQYSAAEQYIASRLLSVGQNIPFGIKVDELEIELIENRLGTKFEPLQKRAIFEAFETGLLILTGGPGTGKTTTLNAIIKLLETRELDIELAAPTGRAAKRITEVTGREAKTIHRLLEVEWGEGEERRFARNEKNPIDCDAIIVDEASMIDSLLFADLLRALKSSCRIILVGDSDQLPSISAGNVLADIIASDVFPCIRLEKVFRQANESMIIRNAHAIIKGEKADFSDKNSDCFLLSRQDKYSTLSTLLELVTERLPAAYNIDSVRDIQVLCPSKMTENGTININNLLQERLNPLKKGQPQVSFKGIYFRVGDKVMQTKNNYDLQFKKDNGEFGSGVFNGDIGFITDIDIRAGIVKVRFDDRVATYFAEDYGQLELAYAITVHKSQGSEYDYVVLPLSEVPGKLKYRNLLYTAVTRSKKMLVCVGSEKIWEEMAANDKKTLRYTLLKHYIEERVKNVF